MVIECSSDKIDVSWMDDERQKENEFDTRVANIMNNKSPKRKKERKKNNIDISIDDLDFN